MSTPKLTAAALAAAALLASPMAHAQYPERPINLVVPFNAGGGTDILIRGFAPELAKALDGNVFVSNTAGGGGTVAASALAQQKPDGYQVRLLVRHRGDCATADQGRAIQP